jgi:hypothetical protein
MKYILRIILITLVFTIVDLLRGEFSVVYVGISFIIAIPLSFLFDKIDNLIDNKIGK